jgi:hypothetical protein
MADAYLSALGWNTYIGWLFVKLNAAATLTVERGWMPFGQTMRE